MTETRIRAFLQAFGLLGFVCLFVVALRPGILQAPLGASDRNVPKSTVCAVRMLAVGDINLGRWVGQQILNGDTLYPFVFVEDTLRSYDIVFANLESNISDQNGRTQHPRNNIIFTAPPAAAKALRRAGITVVATANNHALDFGLPARNQTLAFLDSAGIAHAGTGTGEEGLYTPAILTVKGIRFAFFAVTDIMNMTDPRWKRFVAHADTATLLPAVRKVRDSVDIVVLSFHGGEEYADRVTNRTRSFARDVLDGGVNLFLGHHPHVPYGIELHGKGLAVHSLGNFVFMQPDRYWTTHSYAVAVTIVRDSAGSRIDSLRCLPLKADFQPAFLSGSEDREKIVRRIRVLSTQEAVEKITW